MEQPVSPATPRRPLRVGVKFFLAVSLLVIAVLAVAAVGLIGVAQTHRQADRLYTLFNDNIQTVADVAALADTLHEIELAALQLISTVSDQDRARLTAEMDLALIPEARELIGTIRTRASDASWQEALDDIEAGLANFVTFRDEGTNVATRRASDTIASRANLVRRTSQIFEPLTSAADDRFEVESSDAALAAEEADRNYRSTLLALGVSVAVSLVAAVLIVVILSRNIVPRIRRYSQFAMELAAGRSTGPLPLSGSDELADLGIALNAMVDQRAVLGKAATRQAEFVDTLQVTSTEDEAHELIKRHLERSVAESAVVVLQRNNSANRLLAATSTACDTELAARLVGADPRSCLAVRFARTHREGAEVAPLLGCALCAERGTNSTCEPLLVGGQVIGSVLVSQQSPLDDDEAARIKTSVAQAAPVLANLRNLALAEFRANNDSLTGLPNKRATDDTLKRMVAQANRSITPLAAIMLDLDHFKQINDQYGHGKGDDVLAAVGAELRACLRGSDFAGRFGGEEFLILLPETTVQGAEQVAEKMRETIAGITVVGVERDITASLGIAQLLEHAGNANSLIREADHALYAAKAAGRNRVVVAHQDLGTGSSADVPEDRDPAQPALDALPI